jgi:hypothetical protein
MSQETRQGGVISGAYHSRREYPIVAELAYKVLGNGKPLKTGRGKTTTFSNTVVWFEAEEALETGSSLELSVAWPAVLDGKVGLRLWIRGVITQVEGNRTGLEIVRYEYRTGPLGNNARRGETAGKTLSAGAA